MKLEVVRVEFVIASEKVADTEELTATPVAALRGAVDATVGRVVSGATAVVKVQIKSDTIMLPAASVTPAAMVARNWVFSARGFKGENLTVLPVTLTVPMISTLSIALSRVKLAVFSVELVIASEKIADTVEFVATPIAELAGDVAETVGGVLSALVPVVKLQVKLAAKGLPAASCAAVVMVAVYCVFAERLLEGTNMAVFVPTATTPATSEPPDVGRSEKDEVLSVEAAIASEKVADIEVFSEIPVAAFDGDVSDIVGGVLSSVPGKADAPPESPTANDGVPSSPPPPPPQPERITLATMAIRNNMLRGFLTLMCLSFKIRMKPKLSAIHMPVNGSK